MILQHNGHSIVVATLQTLTMKMVLFPPEFNPLPTNGTHAALWTLHNVTGIYMGDLILGIILRYMVSALLAAIW